MHQCFQCNAEVSVPKQRTKVYRCKCPDCGAQLQFAANADSEQPEPRPVPRKTGSAKAIVLTLAFAGLATCVCLPICGGVAGYFVLDKKIDLGQPFAKNLDPIVLPPIDDKEKDPVQEKPPAKVPLEPQPERTHTIPFHAIATRQRLEQVKAIQLTGNSTFAIARNVNPVTITWESLRRLKYEEKIGSDTMITLLIGNQGWMTSRAKNITLQGDGLAFYQNFNYATTLSNLIPLTEDGFQTESAGDATVRGKNCFIMLIKRAGRPDLKMFFETESNLLYKAEFKGRFVDRNLNFMPNTTLVEFYFSDYQVFDGIRHWKKKEQWRNGARYSELTLSDVKFLSQPDDALFNVSGLDAELQLVKNEEKQQLIQRTLASLKADAGSDFARLVNGLADAARRDIVMKALHAHIELARKNQTPPLVRADVPALLVLLRPGTDPDLQAFAIDGAARLGPDAADALTPLTALARDPRDPQTLAATLDALKKIDARRPDVLTLFEKHLDYPDARVKTLATQAVLEYAPDRLPLNRLVRLMNQPDNTIRAASTKVLRQRLLVVKRSDLPQIREGLNHLNPEVQLLMIDAVANLKDDGRDAAPELISLVGSDNKDVAAQSLRVLDQLGKLTELARDATQSRTLMPVLTALKAKGTKTDEVLTIYEKQMTHTDANVNQLATLALLDLAPERLSLNRLLEIAARPNAEIRAVAEKLVRQKLATATAKDLPGLREGLKNPVPETRLAFLDAVAALKADGAAALPEVANLLVLADKNIVLAAIRTLEGMGKAADKATPALAKSLDNPEKAIAHAATLALCKIDPANAVLKTKGIDLLLESLEPDVADPKAFAAQPLSNKAAAILLDIGEPAVAPIVKHFLTKHTPKTIEARRVEPTASRWMGYEFLKEFANRAKTKDDKKLTAALKRHEIALRAVWEPQESALSKDASRTPGMSAEHKMIYAHTAQAAYQAHRAVSALRAP